jgi:ATP/maltotriose-dependent transcriptional regulator MalT
LLREQDLDVVGPFYALLNSLRATDALDLADQYVDQAVADAHIHASIPALAFALAFRGCVALRRGAVGDAEADARTALALLTTRGVGYGAAFALGVLIDALIERGELDDADEALARSGFGEQIPSSMATNDLLEARGLLHLANGRTRAGLDDLVEFGRRDEILGAASPLASRWRSHASVALAALGDSEQARQLARDDLQRARRWGAASGIGVALRAGALVEAGPAAIDRLREAVDVLARAPARLEHARALTDLGAALRRANRRAEARDVLDRGLELAQRCGALALAERAQGELLAAGGRVSDPHGTGLQLLTASERRVAQLAAEGRSNPEIAQALFVTRKTVETHLGHVYRKLGISGRGDLPQELGGR